MDLIKVFRETIPTVTNTKEKVEYCQRCGTWLSHETQEVDQRKVIVLREYNVGKQYINQYGLPFNLCPECNRKLEEGRMGKIDIHLITEYLYYQIYKLGKSRKEKIYDYAEEHRNLTRISDSEVSDDSNRT